MKPEEKIQTKMMEHGMLLQFDSMIEGASVDLYRYNPTIGLKMSRIRNYADDVEQVLGITGIRVLAPIPGSSLVGFEVPRADRTFPALPAGKGFDIAIGQTIMGETRRFDLREGPHVLIAGAAGSGKSVQLASIITQLSRITEKPIEMHLYDPKIVELSLFRDNKNVVEYSSDPISIQKRLTSMVKEMNDRYALLAKAKVRKIDEYPAGQMVYKYLIVDEFSDLMMSTKDGFVEWELCDKHLRVNSDWDGELMDLLTTKKKLRKHETEMVESVAKCEHCKKHVYPPLTDTILKIAQKGRAAGMHLIMATQRPSVDVISGTIKANFPVKMAFKTSKAIDSMIILDEEGAEKLLGKGDMLFAGDRGVERLQGFNV